jgi:DNA ligase-1
MHQCFQPVEGEFQFAQYGNSNVLDEIQELLEASVKASCEGLMVKMLDTAESGYEPSKRSRNWLKVRLLEFILDRTLANLYVGQKRLPRWCG